MAKKTKEKWEFGDFQTPDELARKAISALRKLHIKPVSVLEPTCGTGSFLTAAIKAFGNVEHFVGVDINVAHIRYLREQVVKKGVEAKIRIIHGDFFTLNWGDILETLHSPVLILGNPPWVTSADLGILQSHNLPEKLNSQGMRGYEAITGKSNFDISEWMLLRYLDWLLKRNGVIAVLCKTSVARKVLFHAWEGNYSLSSARIYGIDAKKYFGASVDACFFIAEVFNGKLSTDCPVYENFDSLTPSYIIGYHDGLVVANVGLYEKWRHLRGGNVAYIWRSGIKHDCSSIMELESIGNEYRNGNRVSVLLEDTYLYPMLKSSDIGNGQVGSIRKYMLVTQKHIGEDTAHIKKNAPQTWRYLQGNADLLRRRASSVYHKRPLFSIFGVGDYAFSPWKIAISGFYKKIDFKVVGPYKGRPVVFDDTVYFLPCWSKEEADFISGLLNSKVAKEFFTSMVFWSDKRPITIALLKKLDLHALSVELGMEKQYFQFAGRRHESRCYHTNGQLALDITDTILM